MFFSVGNLLSPLYPLFSFLQALMLEDTDDDKPDNSDQKSDNSGQADEQDDGGSSDDEDDQDDTDDSGEPDDGESDDDADNLDDDLDQEEINGREADTAISKANERGNKMLMTTVKWMAKHPEDAEEYLEELRKEQPEEAQRLAKMYEGQKNVALKDALKEAPDSVRDLLSKLVDDVGSLKQKSHEDIVREERRVYKSWEKEKHPYLNSKDDAAQTKVGKELLKQFREALNRLPDGEPITEDLLEDALVIAKRRSGWNNSRVSEQVKQQAKEQAQKARSGAAASGKSKASKGESKSTPSRITDAWPGKTEDRQKKVDEIKRKKGFIK